MPDLNREFLRRLAKWSSDGLPVSSLYLDLDGRRYPRRHDYERRAQDLGDRLVAQAEDMGREAKSSVLGDRRLILDFFDRLDRRWAKGAALFSSSRAGLWEEILVPRSLADRAVVARHPHVLPLEALVEVYESFCTVIVDREKARIFLAKMGRIEEQTEVLDEVPGQHSQGGRAQLNRQQHIEDLVSKHLKHVAEVLLGFFQRKKFDHLIVAGPEELVPDFERGLHDYLKRRIAMRTTLAMTSSPEEVLQKSLGVEEAVEAERERRTLERLTAEAAAGRQAITGLDPVLKALNDGRVDTLVVPFGLEAPGRACTQCGRLSTEGKSCATCGGRLDTVPDVVESAVAAALRQSSRVETLSFTPSGEGTREVGALLRY